MAARPHSSNVVWSIWLLLLILGSQVVTLGLVALFAATPGPASAALAYDGNGSRTFVTAPVPAEGSRTASFLLLGAEVCPLPAPSATPPPGSSGPPNSLPTCANLTVARCSPTYASPGPLLASVALGSSAWISLQLPAGLSQFQLTLSQLNSSFATLLVVVQWYSGYGTPTGLTSTATLAGVAALVGLGMLTAGAVARWQGAPAPATAERDLL